MIHFQHLIPSLLERIFTAPSVRPYAFWSGKIISTVTRQPVPLVRSLAPWHAIPLCGVFRDHSIPATHAIPVPHFILPECSATVVSIPNCMMTTYSLVVPSHIVIPKVQPTDCCFFAPRRENVAPKRLVYYLYSCRENYHNQQCIQERQLSLHCLAAHLLCTINHITLHQSLGIQPYQIG